MEFVTQLWAYKSDKFYLGVRFPELLKNHIWLLLIVLKTAILGFSLAQLTKPDFFANFFQNYSTQAVVEPDPHSNNVFQGTERKYKFTPTTCKDDKNLQL